MKPLKIIFLIIALVGVTAFILIFYNNVLLPAQLSVKTACRDISEEELNSKGYFTAGSFSVEELENGSLESTILIIDKSPETLRHELIHNIQYEKKRLYSCDYRFYKFMNEVEAYTLQNFGNNFLNKYYHTNKF